MELESADITLCQKDLTPCGAVPIGYRLYVFPVYDEA